MDFMIMSTDSVPWVLTALGGATVLLIGWVFRLEMKLRSFTRGKSGASLEGTIGEILAHHSATEDFKKKHTAYLERVHQRLTNAARGIATIRYNALTGDTSGMQSFATAILSERGDGVVFSSIHSRAGTRMYAKPVVAFASEHELSQEEIDAIATARSRCEAC